MRRTREQYAETEFLIVADQIKRRREQFIARIERFTRTDGECVLWTGSRTGRGAYPGMNARIPNVPRADSHFKLMVHRVALILRTGKPIPLDKEAGHFKCHNPLCIKHVQLETRAENLAVRDERTALKRITQEAAQ